ncbi:MAG: lysophospholipid acyltransferase family protein [Gemmatimonadetes bacterium]|nr:lysophospholipid acyltransferase family protein [Gemmatimonadota bacterium]
MDARLRLAARLAPAVVRGLGRTLRFEVRGVDRLREARERSPGGRVIFCFLHGQQLALAALYRGRGLKVIVSRHRDGELGARVALGLGYRPIRGSTRRGGARALLEALRGERENETADFAVTPDGPRGPAGRFTEGAIFLAARTGLPIVPVGCSARRAWHARSWDAYEVPWPFSRVRVIYGQPLRVPATLPREARERWRGEAERNLRLVTEEACRWSDLRADAGRIGT